MKVLHLIDNMDLGGAQFLAKGIFEKYQNPNFHLFVLRKTDTIIPINHKNVSFSKSSGKFSIKSIFEIKKYIIENKIDILHCYLLKSQIFAFILKRLFFPNITLIFHELGEIFINKSLIFEKFLKISKNKVDFHFAASKATKEELVKRGDIKPEKIKVLYNYILFENFTKEKIKINVQKEKLKYSIEKNEIVLGYAGRLSEEKGCEYLVKAIPKVKRKVKLLIAGKGAEEKKLKQIVKDSNINDKVFFLGFVSDIMSFYPLIDILVIPSEHESFGLIAIEVQALGIPVIATNIPGLNEVVINNETGLLFERKNAKDLAEKLNKLIENKELKEKLIKGGYENVKKYNIDDYYKQMLNIYYNLTN